jgi:hypothetical protein
MSQYNQRERGAAGIWYGVVNEKGNFSVLARLTSLSGSGGEVIRGEGFCLKQADVSTITCKVFDLGIDKDNPAGTPVLPDPALSPTVNIFDSLVMTGWNKDNFGYNFRHDVVPAYDSYVGTGLEGAWFLLEYKLTLVDNTVMWLKVKVKTTLIQTP